jgi:hypothetical protein
MNFGLVIDMMRNPNVTKDAIKTFLLYNGYDALQIEGMLEKSIATVCYYDQRALVTGTPAAPGTVNFFGKQLGTVANTNMKNGSYTLPADEHIIVDRIKILYAATSATLTDNDWDWGATTVIAKNMQFEIKFNNTTIANLLPGTGFNSELTTDDQGTIRLPNLILWKGQTYAQITANTYSTAPANAALRFEIWGTGLIS